MADLTKLGRYQIKGVLGRGAMGVVYEGLDPSLNRRVAIKTILKNAAIDAETAQHYSAQFAREAQAAGRLNHPNIVGVHDFAEEGEVAYLVMEYIQGRELRSFFDKKERFTVAETVRIMGELLDALDFAHEAGVIHRDVKPANVMLDMQRRVKLADFGVARIQDSERSAAGTMVGTPAFMSPEQIQGMKIDRRTDIFSAGTILYQLLTGDQPFTGAGAWTVAKKIMEETPPLPSSVVQSVSPVFDAIVNKALAKKAADRFGNAKEFAAMLRAAVGPAQPSAMMSMPPTPAAKPSKAAPQASETELEFWKAIQNSTDAAEFEFYLEQFPEGTYSALARHKIARLTAKPVAAAETTVRLEAEAAEKQKREAEEKARQEAEAASKRAAEEKARQAAQAKADADARAKKVAEEMAQQRQAAEKAKREADERSRQAAALAKLKQQEEARKSAASVDPEATVAISRPAARPAPRPAQAAAAAPAVAEEQKKSFLVPAIIGAVVIVAGAGAFFVMNRKPAPELAVEAPVPAKPAAAAAVPAAAPAPVVDEAKIRREVEERIRREYADKSAAEQAAVAKAATEKAIQEKKTAAKAATEKQSADRAAAEKAAADKAMAEKLAAAKSAGERAALEKITAEKAAADAAAAEKAAAERAAADKAAAEKLAVAKAAVPAGPSHEELLAKFIQKHGRDKVMAKEPPNVFGSMRHGEIVYVNNGSCGPGRIQEVTGGSGYSGMARAPRGYRCISLSD